jgi:hypothetical protein
MRSPATVFVCTGLTTRICGPFWVYDRVEGTADGANAVGGECHGSGFPWAPDVCVDGVQHPDAPPTMKVAMFPVVHDIPYHYANPVSGRTKLPKIPSIDEQMAQMPMNPE